VLERDFARHHDAVHYADAIAVPQAALSKTLVQVTGRTTKEHVTDRGLLEAARLLRFTRCRSARSPTAPATPTSSTSRGRSGAVTAPLPRGYRSAS